VFESFFPKPKLFFTSVLIWTAIGVAIWYTVGDSIAAAIGLNVPDPGAEEIIGVGFFTSGPFLWFYLFYLVWTLLFAAFWMVYSPHKWQRWSILGSIFILFTTYFGVQISVALNVWRRPFFDMVQKALEASGNVQSDQLYELLVIFAQIAFISTAIFVVTRFFVSHYVFRWRTAMNDFYMDRWPRVRHIEGASQRVQEDTMRFASIVEGLGVAFVDAIMTLIAFLPILWSLSRYVTELPLVGEIPAPLFTALIFWAVFGTAMLAAVGIKLPGLEFRNQRVEAAYRKELVYGEDRDDRAQPATVRELFGNVRKNYFRLYFNYLYFNIFRSFYIQADNIFAYFILIPTIAAAKITFGLLQQILTAFSQVSNSFQFLVNSWTTIVELMSIYKRLHAFEAVFRGEDLPEIDKNYLAQQGGYAQHVADPAPGQGGPDTSQTLNDK